MIKRWPLKRGGHAWNRISSRPHPAERVGLYSLVSRRVITPLSDTTLHAICMRPLGRRLLSFSTLFGRKPNPMEARPSANRKSDYELTCRCFFRVYYAPYNATLALESSHPGLPPWGRLQLSRLLFRNPPRILSPSPAGKGDGRVKFRLFFNLLPCVEFRIGLENVSSAILNHHSERE